MTAVFRTNWLAHTDSIAPDDVAKLCAFDPEAAEQIQPLTGWAVLAPSTKMFILTRSAVPLDCSNIGGLFGPTEEIIGKVEFEVVDKVCKIKWIYAPGNGKLTLATFTAGLLTGGPIEELAANVCLDPRELDATVMCRLNFWFGRGFRVISMDYHDSLVMLKMCKLLPVPRT